MNGAAPLFQPEVRDEAFPAPRVIVSLGFGFEPVRCNAEIILDDFVRRLARHCEVIAVCPEVGELLAECGGVDGFVLGSRSCVVQAFPAAAIEDEGRLRSDAVRERFLTLLFALPRLRAVEESGRRAALVDFHARYKYTLLAYEEQGMRELGRIVASVAERPWADTLALYRARFVRALRSPAKLRAHINALTHAFGHVSNRLNAAERQFFLDQLDELRAGRLPLAGALTLVRSWVLRFDVPWLAAQTCFRPYPVELQ